MIRFLHDLMRPQRYPSTAAGWAARAQAGRMSSAEQRALDAWLKADPRNAEAYASCHKIGHLASLIVQRPDRIYALPAYRKLLDKERRRTVFWRPILLSGAALAASVVAVIVVLSPASPFGQGDLMIATSRGEQRQVPLQDGSRVHVNTDSRLRIAFSEDERRVELNSGEAFFDVQRDPGRPFVVIAGDSEIRVLGTKFSVRRDAERLDVVVTEGQVKVRPAHSHASPHLPAHVDLRPGDELRLDLQRKQMKVVSVDAEHVTAWRNGFIHFDGATLDEVIADVNRYTPKQFVIDDEHLHGLRLSGSFKIGDTESVRFALKDGFGITTSERNDTLYLSQRPAG